MYKLINTYENILNDEFLNKILWFNGITNKNDYDKLNTSSFPFLFENVDAFIDKINKIASNGQKITIVGDYDADGICSVVIMSKFLNKLGVNNDYIIGDRFTDGYGLNNSIIDEAIKRNSKLIITVDNGIKSKEPVSYALSNGIDIIITDHHQPDEETIPNTLIFDQHYKTNMIFKDFCGAMLALSLVFNYIKSPKSIVNTNKDFMFELYELAGLASLGDVMPLFDINRKVVKQLIKDIKTNNIYNKGLKTLLDTINYDITLANSNDIAFKVIPILNAPGRLSSANIAIDMLLNNDLEATKECIRLNEKRKNLTRTAMNSLIIKPSNINVLYADSINEGIIGIVAGRIKEMTNKPTFIFTDSNDGIKGSARSVKGFDIFNATKSVIDEFPDICISYGGHPDALGITLKNMDSLQIFKKQINRYDTKDLTIDNYYIDYDFLSFENEYKKIESLEPFGQAFNEPIFHLNVEIKSPRILGNAHTSFYINRLNFICFNKVIEDGKYDIFFSIKKELYNESFYYKGHVKSIYKCEDF